MSLKLWGYWRSSASWRVRWALRLKGLDCEQVFVNLKTGEQRSSSYLQINDSGRVPFLQDSRGPSFSQSLAIISYLDAHPEANAYQLFPADPVLKARAFELWEVIAADTHPLQNLSVQQKYSAEEAARKEWACHFIRRGLSIYSGVLRRWSSGSPFSLGSTPTLPDLALVPQIYNGLRFGVDVVQEFPSLWSIYEVAMATKDCHASAPEQQEDAC